MMRFLITLCERSIEYSDYGYWVTPRGDAIVVPDAQHFKILLQHYRGGTAQFSQDRYQAVIDEGWCWVFVGGSFICFLEPAAVMPAAAATLIRIINEYSAMSEYRFVTDHASRKQDWDNAAAAKAFVRSLVRN